MQGAWLTHVAASTWSEAFNHGRRGGDDEAALSIFVLATRLSLASVHRRSGRCCSATHTRFAHIYTPETTCSCAMRTGCATGQEQDACG